MGAQESVNHLKANPDTVVFGTSAMWRVWMWWEGPERPGHHRLPFPYQLTPSSLPGLSCSTIRSTSIWFPGLFFV